MKASPRQLARALCTGASLVVAVVALVSIRTTSADALPATRTRTGIWVGFSGTSAGAWWGVSVESFPAPSEGEPGPTGTVTMRDADRGVLSTAQVTNSGASLRGIPSGHYRLTIDYAGDARYAPSSSGEFAQDVSKNPVRDVNVGTSKGGSPYDCPPSTTTTLPPCEPGGKSTYGEDVAISVAPMSYESWPRDVWPSGTVELFDNHQHFATLALHDGGVTIHTSTLAVGGHFFTATYGGDEYFAAPTSHDLYAILSVKPPKESTTTTTPTSTTGSVSQTHGPRSELSSSTTTTTAATSVRLPQPATSTAGTSQPDALTLEGASAPNDLGTGADGLGDRVATVGTASVSGRGSGPRAGVLAATAAVGASSAAALGIPFLRRRLASAIRGR